MPGFRKLIVTLTALALAMFALAACGGDDESSDDGSTAAEQTSSTTTSSESETGGSGGSGGGSEPAGGGGGTVEIEADPGELAYTTGDVEAPAGEITIAFDNPADIGHDVRVEDSSGADLGGTDVITNDSTTATVELEAGDYTYFCSVPGHQPAGMEGKLTVK